VLRKGAEKSNCLREKKKKPRIVLEREESGGKGRRALLLSRNEGDRGGPEITTLYGWQKRERVGLRGQEATPLKVEN